MAGSLPFLETALTMARGPCRFRRLPVVFAGGNKNRSSFAGTAAPGPICGPITCAPGVAPQTPSSERRGRQRIHMFQDTEVWFTMGGSLKHGRSRRKSELRRPYADAVVAWAAVIPLTTDAADGAVGRQFLSVVAEPAHLE